MKRIALFLCALAAAGSAHAFGIGVRAGTTGLGADVAWNVAPLLDFRLGYSHLNWDKDVSTDAVRYDGEVKLRNLNALVDFTPLGPLFRITGGFIFHDTRYDVRGQDPGVGTISGTVEPGRDVIPYLGIGYGTVAGAGVNFYADLGILFMGSPRARLSVECGPISAAACASLQGQAAAEQARLENELDKWKYYPVLNIGFTIGF